MGNGSTVVSTQKYTLTVAHLTMLHLKGHIIIAQGSIQQKEYPLG